MDTQSPTSAPARKRHPWRLTAALVVAAVIAGVAFVGIARATDQPSFCGSACHEMGPYHEAWSKGAHKNVACIECHVDEGTVARMEHKVAAMKEVAAHVSGDPKFPMNDVAPVPSERCKRCHPKVELSLPGFSHADHEKRGPCASCHSTAGHSVTTASLKAAGIFNATATRTVEATKSAVVDGGKANLPNHIAVPCSRCHDMAATKCSACHKPKHVDRGPDCTICHSPGPKFVFAHPARTDCGTCHKPTNAKHTWQGECTTCHKAAAGSAWTVTHPASGECAGCHTRPANHKQGNCTTCHRNTGVNWAFAHPASDNCASCHNRPANHKAGACASCHKNPGVNWAFAHPASDNCASCHNRPANHKAGACASCHKNPGRSWAFSHPGAGANCASCHARPANHRAGSCATCHSPGKKWTFRHPGSKANCASCHPRPGGHRSGSCTTCHSVGKTWAFRHPAAGSSCANCHARPGGHSGGACQNCHSPGSKWVFRHGSGLNCASCHKAPAGHYGTTCQNCHSPSRAWTNATFSHPRVPGGEHSYKSFACSKCHPSGPPAHYCTCHNSATGPKGD